MRGKQLQSSAWFLVCKLTEVKKLFRHANDILQNRISHSNFHWRAQKALFNELELTDLLPITKAP